MILSHQWHRLFKVSISVASAVPSTRGRIARTSLELLSSWNGGSFRSEAQKENASRWHRDLDHGGRAGEAAWGCQTEKCGCWGNYFYRFESNVKVFNSGSCGLSGSPSRRHKRWDQPPVPWQRQKMASITTSTPRVEARWDNGNNAMERPGSYRPPSTSWHWQGFPQF